MSITRIFNTAPKTYKTRANAIKAVEDWQKDRNVDGDQTYLIATSEDGRFFPVFIGERAIQIGIHFNFCTAN